MNSRQRVLRHDVQSGQRPAGTFLRFWANETGSFTVFTLFIIIIMLFAGGLAVDFMRQEAARARAQSTLDRALLAAADMDQTLTAEEVIRDYFDKAGLDGSSVIVDPVPPSSNSRVVHARVNQKIDSYFLNILGIDQLDVPASGGAQESISNIEISLVLDMSYSMTQNSKINNLITAANKFVDVIYAQTEPTRTSISIVPYATQVNAGAKILKWYNVTSEHNYSHCVDFTDTDYTRSSLSTTDLLQRTGHFDASSSSNTQTPSWLVCRPGSNTEILPHSGSITALKTKINGLTATGYTSIDVGVKWGAALLDPSARPMVTGMIGDTTLPADQRISSNFSGRPLPYNNETLKVIVVLTDGINTKQWYLRDPYKSGPSLVWRDPATGKMSVMGNENGNKDGDGVVNEVYFNPSESGGNKWSNTPLGGAAAVRLSYPELWSYVTVEYNADKHMKAMTGNNLDYLKWTTGYTDGASVFHPGVYSLVEGVAKDTRLNTVCTAAKTAGITIYSIGFEVTDDSALVMQNCATTPGHFFRVGGAALTDVFASIANNIGQLRLTQ